MEITIPTFTIQVNTTRGDKEITVSCTTMGLKPSTVENKFRKEVSRNAQAKLRHISGQSFATNPKLKRPTVSETALWNKVNAEGSMAFDIELEAKAGKAALTGADHLRAALASGLSKDEVFAMLFPDDDNNVEDDDSVDTQDETSDN